MSRVDGPEFSVVVPTRNRPVAVERCVRAICGGSRQPVEVLVVNDGGSIDSAEGTFRSLDRVRVLERRQGGPAAARNTGVAVARADWVAFTDDDCVPSRGWLEALGREAADRPEDAVGGPVRNGFPSDPYSETYHLILDIASGAESEDRFFPAMNIAFAVAALRHVGGFDEAFRFSEDRELCYRWRERGGALRLAPDAWIEHRPEMSLGRFCETYVGHGRGAAALHRSRSRVNARAALRLRLRIAIAVARRARGGALVAAGRLGALVALWELCNVVGYADARLHREWRRRS